MMPDRKKKINAQRLLIGKRRESSESRLSSQRMLYSSRVSNRDVMTRIQGVNTVFYDE